MAPTVDQLRPTTPAQQQLLLEQKRAFLTKHPASRRFLFEPSRLWGLIVTHRYIPPSIAADSSEAHEYEDLRLSFANFKKIAYIVLFGDGASEEEAAADAPVVAGAAALTAEEKELIFFKHPFLSPKTFLMFERSVDNYQSARSQLNATTTGGGGGNLSHDNSINNSTNAATAVIPETVAAVPLYTYIAKKMLLFRIRIMLELVASVPPPTLKVAPSAAALTSATATGFSVSSVGGASASAVNHPLVRSTPPEDDAPISPTLAHLARISTVTTAEGGGGAGGDHISASLSSTSRQQGGGAAQQQQRHCAPSPSSPFSNGLTQDDIEAFIKQLVPHTRLVRDMPAWLLPYYLCHASRKIMFMLDPRGLGVVSIEAFMVSEVFSEMIRMYESEVRDAVVAFPVGCALEVLPATVLAGAARHHDNSAVVRANGGKFDTSGGAIVPEWIRRAAATGDDDYHLKCSVEDFENEGNDPTDAYTISVVCPKEFRDPETGIIDVFTVIVPRDGLVWCPSTTAYIPPELSAVTNWFSLPLMYRIYDHFTLLDADSDGVLSFDEFRNYSSGSYTDLAARRVFDVHVRDSGGRQVMDYKAYLTFVVATEHVGTPQGKKYLWDVLDIEHTSDRISVNALRLFCREISEKLAEHGLMKITGDSILSEIIDMINPAWHEWITREDVARSRQHHTVLPILLSHRNFYAYDCREQSAAQTINEYV